MAKMSYLRDRLFPRISTCARYPQGILWIPSARECWLPRTRRWAFSAVAPVLPSEIRIAQTPLAFQKALKTWLCTLVTKYHKFSQVGCLKILSNLMIWGIDIWRSKGGILRICSRFSCGIQCLKSAPSRIFFMVLFSSYYQSLQSVKGCRYFKYLWSH